MSHSRKLQADIDRVLKRVQEGVDVFDTIWEKVYAASTQALKEKFEAELKKEIKKLQRFRDQIKTWITSNDVKDKKKLTEARRLIETKMEQFKICEKETKTKAYSKEGLAKQEEEEVLTEEQQEALGWVSEQVEAIKELIAEAESEMESLESSRGRRGRNNNSEELEMWEGQLNCHKFHINKIARLGRMIKAGVLPPDSVDELRDTVEYYLESYDDPDFYDDREVYDFMDDPSKQSDAQDSHEGDSSSSAAAAVAAATSSAAAKSAGSGSSSKKHSSRSRRGIGIAVGNAAPARKTKAAAAKPTTTETTTKAAANSGGGNSSGSNGAPVDTLANIILKNGGDPRKRQQLAQQQLAQQQLAQQQLAQQQQQQQQQRIKAQEQEQRVRQQEQRAREQQQQQAAALARQKEQAQEQQRQLQQQREQAAAVKSAPGQKPTAAAPGRQQSTVVATTAASLVAPGQGQVAATPEVLAAAAAAGAAAGGPVAQTADVTASATAADPAAAAAARAALDSAASQLNGSLGHLPEAHDTDRTARYTPRNPHTTPACFPSSPAPLFSQNLPAATEKLDTDSLFFMFYFQQGTRSQYLAARQLKRASWRYHKKYMTWFQRHEEPKVTTDEFEQGTYVYFDYETGWCQRIKSEFTFEYSYLEDELPV